MKSKVTLKELVGTQIVSALLLACYYWTWARRDWHDYYAVIQNIIILFALIFFALLGFRICKYGKEEKHKPALQILHRIDAIILKMTAVVGIAIAFACAVAFIDGRMAGCALMGTIVAFTVLRFILFCTMEKSIPKEESSH